MSHTDTMTVISLGWGVQSFALAAMSALGVLPPVDAAIHADTGHERSETYALAHKWTPWLAERGVRVITVSAPPKIRSIDQGVSPPYFTFSLTNKPSMLHRTCTERWKIRPINRWLQANRHTAHVNLWLGITRDEIERTKPSTVKYKTLSYPFLQILNPPHTRAMVIHWLRQNNLPVPVKSSCVFCPYRDRATWREIQLADNGDWHKALEIDRAIRNRRPGYQCYLVAQRKPLDQCDFRSQQEHGQLEFWEQEECSGMCFL
jgi:hypothetical protein